MGRFDWEEGEIETAGSQCELCVFDDAGGTGGCARYAAKPPAVVKTERRCEYFQLKDLMNLES